MTKESIKAEMFTLRDMLKKCEQEFNMTDNEDLIEALIYEQKAMQSRFAFLMKQAKRAELEIDFSEGI